MRFRTLLALALALCMVFGPAALSLAKTSSSSSSSRSSFSSSGSRSSSSSGWSSSSKPSSTSSSGTSSSTSSSSGWSSGSSSTPSGSSSGSTSGTSSGWSSGSGSSAQSPSSPAGPSGSSSWSNSSGASSSTGSKSSSTSAFSSSGASSVNKSAATKSYQEYQGQFGKSGNPVNPGQVSTSKPILNQNRTFGSYQDYSSYRGDYYAGRGWSAPGYAFHSYSSFGMWDAMFMWFMLSHLGSGSSFFYNHQSDPGVQAFKQEAQKLSESNADLKKQLDELNAKLDQMKKDGTPVDPNALPKDVDPNVVMAQPKIENKNAASSMLWPIVGLVAFGGAAYFMFFRRRA
ncbi:hypothetical protein [Fundidesulfovibrio agrisoli]|uniref:hypothetical protein n=1 Tax=Fundidesulfovibrio agrisoli TaxID=2922717 RepID=UPI001FAC59B3|nr:hypothetical protein [Fundidesulfovibrio agrisoli]